MFVMAIGMTPIAIGWVARAKAMHIGIPTARRIDANTRQIVGVRIDVAPMAKKVRLIGRCRRCKRQRAKRGRNAADGEISQWFHEVLPNSP